jgi:hypothetical protein
MSRFLYTYHGIRRIMDSINFTGFPFLTVSGEGVGGLRGDE